MDTKWRNFPNWFYSRTLKWFACVLLVICTASALLLGTYMGARVSYGSVTQENYLSSDYRASEMGGVAAKVARLLTEYKSEEFIRGGGLVDMKRLENNIYNQYRGEYIDEQSGYEEAVYEETRQQREERSAKLKQQILEEYKEELEEAKQKKIMEQLNDYFSILEFVNASEGIYYYATDGENTLGNVQEATKEFFKQQPGYILYDHGKVEQDDALAFQTGISNLMPNDAVYVAFSSEEIALREQKFQDDKQYMENVMIYLILLLVMDLLCGLYLLFAAGRKPGDDNIHLCPVDRIYSDVNLALAILIGILAAACCAGLYDYMNGYSRYMNDVQAVTNQSLMREPVILLGLGTGVFACVSAVVTLLLSLVRGFKAKHLLRHTLIWSLLRKIWRGIKFLLSKGPVLLVSTQQVNILRHGVQRVRNGELEHRIRLPKGKMLYGLAEDINSMSEGLQNAVEKELKAERLKTELITNVSHDLKTPLTSIINYSDLLTKEELTPDFANDYAKVIKTKSEKLKQLTNDLFEISKVQSGNIEVQLEQLQVKALIMQSVAEYEEKFKEVPLDVRISPISDELYICSDGKKMARVLENLVVNIIKYAQPHSRVYIDVMMREDKCDIVFKNIASYEMNFNAEEVMQRFVRGDESRTGDGNGLGLAIAQSYVEACGGTFRVEVDGDLFKSTVTFEKVEARKDESER